MFVLNSLWAWLYGLSRKEFFRVRDPRAVHNYPFPSDVVCRGYKALRFVLKALYFVLMCPPGSWPEDEDELSQFNAPPAGA